MVQLSVVAASFLATFMLGSLAHPGEQHSTSQVKREIQVRDHYASISARSLGRCASTIESRALQQRAITRRAAAAKKLRAARGLSSTKEYLHRRNLTSLQEFETANHNMTGVFASGSTAETLFAANTTCILTPENTIGPYYVRGELMRSNVTEDQDAISMHLDMQFVDTATCGPVSGLLIDIWAANATGVYSGISTSSGQGGLNSTFGRGFQQTNRDGVVEFDTYFPGHYDGRATHEHVVAHANSAILSNGTYTGGRVEHIGQLFFDESLRSAVEATYPYSSNTAEVTSNDDDMWAPTQADNDYDPFPEWMYVGDDIKDGLLMWISIGIDTTANYTSEAAYAATLTAEGGVENEDSSFSASGGGNGTGNGTVPSGTAVPSGTPPARLI